MCEYTIVKYSMWTAAESDMSWSCICTINYIYNAHILMIWQFILIQCKLGKFIKFFYVNLDNPGFLKLLLSRKLKSVCVCVCVYLPVPRLLLTSYIVVAWMRMMCGAHIQLSRHGQPSKTKLTLYKLWTIDNMEHPLLSILQL